MSKQSSQYNQGQGVINMYLKGSAAVGFIPIPAVDTALLLGAQLKMINELADIYEVDYSEHKAKSLTASLFGSILPLSLTVNLFSICKGIPVIGQAVGILGMPILGGASTYAVGQVFIQHFETGGTLLDFDPQKMKAYYKAEFEKGKEKAKKSYAGIKP